MDSLRERLARGDVLVGDGAWGTMLMARGLAPGRPPESLVLERPEAVREVALLYLDAGAELLTTDTFGGSPLCLGSWGLGERAEEINARAVSIAREAAAGRALVQASVGPTGRILAPLGDTEPAEVGAAFARQIGAQARAGADAICIETMTDLAEMLLAVRAAHEVAPDLPVIATMTFDPTPRGFFTMMGVSVEQAARALTAAGVDVVGSNCGNGIDRMVAIARELRRWTSLPLAIRSNAGLPESRGAEVVYPETPELMAERIPALLDAGVSIVGGCCGTTPDHVRAFRRAVDARKLTSCPPP